MNCGPKETHNVVGLLPLFCVQKSWVHHSCMLLHTTVLSLNSNSTKIQLKYKIVN